MVKLFCFIKKFDIRLVTGSRAQNITCDKILGWRQKILILTFFSLLHEPSI